MKEAILQREAWVVARVCDGQDVSTGGAVMVARGVGLGLVMCARGGYGCCLAFAMCEAGFYGGFGEGSVGSRVRAKIGGAGRGSA